VNSSILQVLGQEEGTRVDLGAFSEDFQLAIILYYIEDGKFLQRIRESFNPEYFTATHLQALAKVTQDYLESFRKMPTLTDIRELINISPLESNIKENMLSDLGRIHDLDISKELVQAKAIDFFRHTEFLNATTAAIEIIRDGYLDDGHKRIYEIFKDAYNSCTPMDNYHDYVKDAPLRYPTLPESGKYGSKASTGFAELDALTCGGIDKGELGIFTAGTGGGKSHLLVHVGCSGLEQEKKVWHISLELTEYALGRRYDSRILGIPVDALEANEEEVLRQVKDMKANLKIAFYPARRLDFARLAGDHDRLVSEGFEPELLILDYPDLMVYNSKGKSRYMSNESRYNVLGYIYEELRSFGSEFGLPVWAASQVNRDGIRQKNVEDLSDISDSIQKAFGADLIASLHRSRDNDVMRRADLYVKKNRHGPDNVRIPLHNIDLSQSYFEVDSVFFDKNEAPNILEFVNKNKTPEITTLANAMRQRNRVAISFADNLKYADRLIQSRNSIQEYNKANATSLRGTLTGDSGDADE
jgi:replicative DNA helicase